MTHEHIFTQEKWCCEENKCAYLFIRVYLYMYLSRQFHKTPVRSVIDFSSLFYFCQNVYLLSFQYELSR